MRFRVREAQVESPRARGSRADGKGWDRLSLSPGKLGLPAGGGSWRAGEWAELGQLWTLFMAETGELSRPGEPFLCSAHRISYLHHSPNWGSPPETVTHINACLIKEECEEEPELI